MRGILGALLLMLAAVQAAGAQTPPFLAGITRLAVDATPSFDTLVIYPTQAGEAPVELGPFVVIASPEAAIARPAAGDRFPIVLFSHGNGRGSGTPLPHRLLLLGLAREGFIVVAPFHAGAARPFVERPRQMRRALEALRADSRFTAHADTTRVGVMGFSFGGAVAILLAGGALDLAHLSAYCRAHAEDRRACDGIPTDDSLTNIPARRSADAMDVRALVLLEPFGAPFQRSGLAALDMPVLIYRATGSDLRSAGNALALARALPRIPRVVAVPGGHFVFVDPCPPALMAEARQVCVDAPGVDRSALHRQMLPAINEFLSGALR
ncbi:MAG: dienelactone hydrolase [Alphaproteobacteria bacterium]|nr:dienelactone hydrolase [Alphaproteobacteria bacterium]MCW5743327.1 dienelactone hydrolase [Alphaproteobacteria bacterium]